MEQVLEEGTCALPLLSLAEPSTSHRLLLEWVSQEQWQAGRPLFEPAPGPAPWCPLMAQGLQSCLTTQQCANPLPPPPPRPSVAHCLLASSWPLVGSDQAYPGSTYV